MRWRGLKIPRDVRLVAEGAATNSAFLEFTSSTDAEAVMEEFSGRLLSDVDNIKFLNLSTKKGKGFEFYGHKE